MAELLPLPPGVRPEFWDVVDVFGVKPFVLQRPERPLARAVLPGVSGLDPAKRRAEQAVAGDDPDRPDLASRGSRQRLGQRTAREATDLGEDELDGGGRVVLVLLRPAPSGH